MEFLLTVLFFVCALSLVLRGFIIRNQNIQIENLKNEKVLAERRDISYQQERKQLEDKLNDEIIKFGDKLDEAYHTQDVLNDTVTNKITEISQLEEENKSLSKDVSHYQEVIKDLHNEIETLEKVGVEISKQLYLEKDKAKNQYNKIKELSDDLTNERERISGLEKLIDKLNIEIGDRSKDKRLLDKYKEIFSNIKFFVDENMGE
jgi:chromosome segregation ATPase